MTFVARVDITWLKTVLVAAALAGPSLEANAQAGVVYRCEANDYTNTLSEAQAASRQCVRISSSDWLFSGSDAVGRQYKYNERRTSYGVDGRVQTWLQVVVPGRPGDAGSSDEETFVRTVSPHVISCRERTISAGATYRLDVRDNSVSKEADPRKTPFPPSEGVARALIDRLCARRGADDRAFAGREGAREQRAFRTSVSMRSAP